MTASYPIPANAAADDSGYRPHLTIRSRLESRARVRGAHLPACAVGRRGAALAVAPTTANLDRVAQLLDSGTLKVPVHDTYELDRAGEALQALAGSHTQGKLAIRVS